MPRSRLLVIIGLAAVLLGGVALWVQRERSSPAPPAGAGLVGPQVGTPQPDPAAVAEVQALLERPVDPSSVFADVSALARDLARLPYVADTTSLPRSLTTLGYDSYRAIEFRSEAAIWRGRSPFEIQLFHPGFLYTRPVHIHLVEDGTVSEVGFDADRFTYEGSAQGAARAAANAPPGSGHAGFRIHYPLNDPDSKDETVVFLGASYFRMLGPGQTHGLSSRGLAVNVVGETPEEFPHFRAFWLARPDPAAAAMVFHALLDSPSVTGAFRFELIPASNTEMEVTARLFARADVSAPGIAPLTSMFLHGPNRLGSFDDFRPRVHDSDGLLMRTSADEWIWRPLSNDSVARVTVLRDQNPRGYGLVQREREFESYLDLEARYDRRPSEWVEILDDWGAGGVELVELPTPSEFNDNIVAYWAPDTPFRAGDEREYRYRLATFDARLEAQSLGQVSRTLIGHDALPGQGDPPPASVRRFVVDFTGGALGGLSVSDSVRPVLVSSSGEVSEPVVQPLPDQTGWRASFRLAPEGNEPADMRLFLEVPGRRVTETWSYVWYPERIR